MKETDGSDVRRSIIDFWKAVMLALIAFSGMVVYIFASSALEWKHEQERLEMIAKQKAAAKVGKIAVVSFINKWEMADVGVRGANQNRVDFKLEPGVEYETGRLRYYLGRNDGGAITYGFDHTIDVFDDDPDYFNPIITVQYSKFIHAMYSIDTEPGWLIYGPTRKGIKGGEYLWVLPEDGGTASDGCDAWGEKSLTFVVPPNGTNGIEVNIDSEAISKEMRGYNYIVTERLGDAYLNVPAEFADRTRKIYTSHVLVEGWRSDPREWKTNGNSKGLTPTPELTVLIRIKRYGRWDLTSEEYESIMFKATELSNINNREFSPYTTIEYVGMLSKATNSGETEKSS